MNNSSASTYSIEAILNKSERLIYILFFFSGFPALFYQLVWQRALFRIFGVNAESVTIVVTAFMLGLGLGNLAGAYLAKLKNVPLLRVFACIEFGIGLFGLMSLPFFDFAGRIVLGLPLPEIAVIVLGLLVVPTLFMGATLPIFVAHFAPRLGNMGASVGSLYYMNTLGAASACFIASILLFPFGGMQSTVYVAVIMNIGISVIAFAGSFRYRSEGAVLIGSHQNPASETKPPLLGFQPLLLCAALGGFISLSYEIFLFRVYSYATGSSAYTFPLTLGFFLLGIASGANKAGELSQNLSHEALARQIKVFVLKAVAVGFVFLPILSVFGKMSAALAPSNFMDMASQHVRNPKLYWDQLFWLTAGGMTFLIAKFWGVLLPCLIELAIRPDEKSGTRVGLVYISNIIGTVFGSILTGFFLTDWFKLVDIASILVIFGVAFLFMFGILLKENKRQHSYKVAVFAVALCCFVPGVQRYLTPHLLYDFLQNRIDGVSLAETVENRHGIIAVDTEGLVYGNGMYDGRFKMDIVHDSNGVVRPFALSLFHPAPRDVLIIGLSSGSWAQIIVHNPEVEHLTIIEINSGYLELIKERPAFASLLSNPKVSIIIDDGRRWLKLHPERQFDAIIANTSHHFRANATNVLSQEFLELLKAHLNKGGIAFYNTTNSVRVQRTACAVFPYGLRFNNHILVSNSPLALDFDRWKRVLTNYEIDGVKALDLSRQEDRESLNQLMALKEEYDAFTAPGDESEKTIESCQSILARSKGQKLVTDDNMGTEWRYWFRKE